jgi:Lar family restriction alleviation protein
MKERLKPCPFCGSEEIQLKEDCADDPAWSITTIKCLKCRASSDRAFRTTDKAVEWWNNRVPTEKKTEFCKCIGQFAYQTKAKNTEPYYFCSQCYKPIHF